MKTRFVALLIVIALLVTFVACGTKSDFSGSKNTDISTSNSEASNTLSDADSDNASDEGMHGQLNITAWDDKKEIVSSVSFDSLSFSNDPSDDGTKFVQSGAYWDNLVDMSKSHSDYVVYNAKIKVKGETGEAGYRVDSGNPIFKNSSCKDNKGIVSLKVVIDLRDLNDSHAVDVCYKSTDGKIVIIDSFSVVMSARKGEKPLKLSLPDKYRTNGVVYTCWDNSCLYTYKNRSEKDFLTACSYYTEAGFTIYSTSDKTGNKFTTFTNGSSLVHVYWLSKLKEMNIVLSEKGADGLPPLVPENLKGDKKCSVYQVKDAVNVNGMAYIVQLTDGSYIIYDGGPNNKNNHASKMIEYLKKNHSGSGKPLVRAWVLTHSHNDHYPTFQYFARNMADQITLEYVAVAPLNKNSYNFDGNTGYLSSESFATDVASFNGAKTLALYTGMEFNFCNLKLEVLYSPYDLYKTDSKGGGDFNNTSVVTRLYDDNYSAMFTGDVGDDGAYWLLSVFGSYLKSDMCQVSHHGVEDVPLYYYQIVQAPILFYPCSQPLYDGERNSQVRFTLEKEPYTKEILIQGVDDFVREWGTTFAANAPLKMPGYTPSSLRK